MSESNPSDEPSNQAERLVEWIQEEQEAPERAPSGTLPPVSRQPHDRIRHFDETGRWLAKTVTIIFGLCLLASWGAIVFKVGDSTQLDGWMRLIIPSLSSLIGAAFGFYFRDRMRS